MNHGPASKLPILVAEDSDEDFMTLQRVLTRRLGVQAPLRRCTTGDATLAELMRYPHQSAAERPILLLLDLNMPGTDGREVLEKIKQDVQMCHLPVVVLTTSDNPQDILRCYQQGANSYVIKPVNLDAFTQSLQVVMDYWLQTVILPPSSSTGDPIRNHTSGR